MMLQPSPYFCRVILHHDIVAWHVRVTLRLNIIICHQLDMSLYCLLFATLYS
jgi:hypothetical protein